MKMKRNWIVLTIPALTFWSGCVSGRNQNVNTRDMPEWFFDPPESSDAMYGVGVAKKESD